MAKRGASTGTGSVAFADCLCARSRPNLYESTANGERLNRRAAAERDKTRGAFEYDLRANGAFTRRHGI